MLTLERTVAIHSYHLIPYASAEIYYESQYSKVSTTELYAGTLFPMGKHFEFNTYYEHQNNTGKHPNQQLHGLGLDVGYLFVKESPLNARCTEDQQRSGRHPDECVAQGQGGYLHDPAEWRIHGHDDEDRTGNGDCADD